ncbi:PKD domain-containing protein [Candidatus Gracilibacteria bacterium]|nr:PKD domain-containing protein [Candidatus Gracilibacteria bacterium]
MFRNILLGFLFFFSSFASVFSADLRVENIFSDIDANYPYLEQLQTLYEQGAIVPGTGGTFNPDALLTRDEFVGILVEIGCEECIQPDVSLDLVQKHANTQPFFDVFSTNQYFYCIAGATDDGYVSGYQAGTTCDDGTFQAGQAPFCPNNTILLEEALAIVLRASGLLTNEQADLVRQQIANGEITADLSDDVSPLNPDNSVYSFYPDFQRALEYQVVDTDIFGNQTIYQLVTLENNQLFPNSTITREDFLQMAYVALRANNCRQISDNSLGVKMKVYDQTCSQGSACTPQLLSASDDTFDFEPEVGGICNDGIDDPNGYIWRFLNISTGEEIYRYGTYVDNFQFVNGGDWRVILRVVDECGNTGEVYNSVSYPGTGGVVASQNADLRATIDAVPIYGTGPLSVSFDGLASGGTPGYTYAWDFDDREQAIGKQVNHVFDRVGFYEVELTVTDTVSNSITATTLIGVNEVACTTDSDGDGINDCDDLCPIISGSSDNFGCPLLETTCAVDSDCQSGYECRFNDSLRLSCQPPVTQTSCVYDGGTAFVGNTVCQSCPCNNSIDFLSSLRRCDVVFPAITSPDRSEIYSRGNIFRVP